MDSRFELGQRVRVSKSFGLHPYAWIDRGETGEVVSIDDDHDTVEVRLHKFHSGLACWTNCALLDSTDALNISPERARLVPRVTTFKAACVAAVIAGVPMSASFAWPWAYPKPPGVVYAASLVSSQISGNEPVIIELVSQRFRICPGEVDTRITRVRDGLVVFSLSTKGVMQSITDEPLHRKIPIELPAGLDKGWYEIERNVFSECDGKTHSMRVIKEAFEVVTTRKE